MEDVDIMQDLDPVTSDVAEPSFQALCLRDVLRRIKVVGVTPDLVSVEPSYDDPDSTGVDPFSDIRSSVLDKAEIGFAETAYRASQEVAAQAANKQALPPESPASAPAAE